MFRHNSLLVLLLSALVLAGSIPLAVVLILSGDVVAAVIGEIVLAAMAGGLAYGLVGKLQTPLRRLTAVVCEIQAAAEAEQIDALAAHVQALETLGGPDDVTQVAVGVAQSVGTFRQRMIEFNSIYAMSQAITAKVDFEQTVQAVLDAVKQVVEFDAAEVSVLRGDKLVVEGWVGQEEFNNTTGREYRVGRGPTGLIASNKASVLVSTLSGEEEDVKRTLGYESAAGEFLQKTTKVIINSFLGIPLLIGPRLIGALTLVHRDPGRFTESERRQLEKLAAQASIAIDNAIQVRQREDALKAQIRELRVEIDKTKIDEQVDEIIGSDYFQTLQAHAAKMRNRLYTRSGRGAVEPDGSVPPGDPPADAPLTPDSEPHP